MKKAKILVLIVATAFLAGCGKTKELPEEQYDLIAEYCAGVLLDNAYANQDRYFYGDTSGQPSIEKETQKPTETPTKEPNKKPTQGSTENQTDTLIKPTESVKDEELIVDGEPFVADGFNVKCKKAILAKTYSPDSILEIEASQGMKLLVFELDIKNESSSARKLAFEDFRAKVDNKQYKIYASGLLNDVTTIADKAYEPGVASSVVVVFSVDESAKSDNIVVIMPDGKKVKVNVIG